MRRRVARIRGGLQGPAAHPRMVLSRFHCTLDGGEHPLVSYLHSSVTKELHLNPGAVLAGYRVHRLLSQGGMGAVYLVEQLATRKQRAL